MSSSRKRSAESDDVSDRAITSEENASPKKKYCMWVLFHMSNLVYRHVKLDGEVSSSNEIDASNSNDGTTTVVTADTVETTKSVAPVAEPTQPMGNQYYR